LATMILSKTCSLLANKFLSPFIFIRIPFYSINHFERPACRQAG